MVVVVLGLKRGGTSVTAGVVHRLGVPVGERFHPPTEFNPDGYWEDKDFADIADRVLRGASIRSGLVEQGDAGAINDLQSFLDGRNRELPRWGVKNFALNYILPEFTRRCGPRPVSVLWVQRSFATAVDSWARVMGRRHDQSLQEQAGLLYNTHHAFNAHRGRRLIVQYEELVERPADVVGRIAEFLGLPVREEAVALVRRGPAVTSAA
jgi:hypothetical protein